MSKKADVNKIEDFTVNNKCSGCGSCCTPFIPFTKTELKEIKAYVKKNKIPFKNRHIENGFDGSCAFLDLNTRKCMIYEVRPFVCRDFICNNPDWMDRRDKYAKRAYYNSSTNIENTHFLTFDDLIYGDVELLLRYIADMCKDENGNIGTQRFIMTLTAMGREDLLDRITIHEVEENKEESK